MAFKYHQINLRGLVALPIKAKDAFPEDSPKWEALSNVLIEQIKTGAVTELKIDDKIFLLKEKKEK